MGSRIRTFSFYNSLSSTLTPRFGKFQNLSQTVKNFETPERLKGTIIERWGKYWKNLFIDYKDVAMDVCKEFRERPIKCSVYVSLLGCSFYLAKHNPDETCFREDLLINSMKMIFVGEQIRNPKSLEHLELLRECYLRGVVRRLNLGIVSFIWLDNYNKECALYKANCSHLKPRYLTFHERIVDVGFLDTWWILKDKMQDYDVNNEEFVHLET